MRRINPAAVLATLALFVSLGGTSFAAAGLIDTDQIENHAVTAHKIAPNAVTTKKISANAVTTGKLAPDAVTGAQVQDGSLTSGDVAPDTFLPATRRPTTRPNSGASPRPRSCRARAIRSPTACWCRRTTAALWAHSGSDT